MKSNNIIENRICELIEKFPIISKDKNDSFKFIHTTHFLGNAKKFPNQNEFEVCRKKCPRHSDVCCEIKHIELFNFFYEFENNKSPFIYIFWADFPSNDARSQSFSHIINSSDEKTPKFNKMNIAKHNDTLLAPIYVGKSEGKLNGRIICHIDGTAGKYPSLKIRDHFNSDIYLSLIQLDFAKTQGIDPKFHSKVMCFSLEYFMALELMPIIGMHK